MKSRGVRVDVLMLTARWPEEAVVRRQILEGVLAVVHLYRADRLKNKVSLRIFNRSGGANNVTFDRKGPYSSRKCIRLMRSRRIRRP